MHKKTFNVLISSIGSASGLNILYCLQNQDQYLFNFVGADSSEDVAGKYLVKSFYQVPNAKDKEYISVLLDICQKESIDFFFPTMSFEYEVLCKNIEIFKNNNVRISLPPPDTWDICANKLTTFQYLKEKDILTPKIYNDEEIKHKACAFPLMVKPKLGRSSINTYKVSNEKELLFFKEYVPDAIVQEYISGNEYTVDLLCDLEGSLLVSVPRIRLETKSGLATKSKIINNENLQKLTKKVTTIIKLPGISNIQYIIDKSSTAYLIEINCRLPAGGLPLTFKAGVNMPLILINMLLGQQYDSKNFNYTENVLMLRYWNVLFTLNGELYE